MLAGAIDKNIIRGEDTGYSLMTDLQQDVELVRRIAGRDETALRELYTAYGQRLYVYALRLTGDRAQVEDVIQDVFGGGLALGWKLPGRWPPAGLAARNCPPHCHQVPSPPLYSHLR